MNRTASAPLDRTPALRAVAATFEAGEEVLVPPFSIELEPGGSGTLGLRDERSARVAARMAAGIVKASSGTLLICDFDPRIQPVQAKRCAGYVPHDGDFGWSPRLQRSVARRRHRCTGAREREGVIDLHAALFDVPRRAAHRRVSATLDALGSDGDFEFAVALALVRLVRLLVLDRPPRGAERRIAEILPFQAALLSTSARAAAEAHALAAV